MPTLHLSAMNKVMSIQISQSGLFCIILNYLGVTKEIHVS